MAADQARLVSLEELGMRFGCRPEQLEGLAGTLPVRWTRYYFDLARDAQSPLARMGLPDITELEAHPDDIHDPVADHARRPLPFLVQKHANRVVVLASATCHFHCRFCFRRPSSSEPTSAPQPEDWKRIFAHLRSHPEIEELILSGGDPLTLSDRRLAWIRDEVVRTPSLLRWRIHTRAIVHCPARIHVDFLDAVRSHVPLTVITHFNHPDELTQQTAVVASTLARASIALGNQTVLLHGINDRVEIQTQLWNQLHRLGVFAHYLHHPDRAPGNARFRLSLSRGLSIYRRFTPQLFCAPPRYVLDLPDGKGKVEVGSMTQVTKNTFRFQHADGSCSWYRDIAHPP